MPGGAFSSTVFVGWVNMRTATVPRKTMKMPRPVNTLLSTTKRVDLSSRQWRMMAARVKMHIMAIMTHAECPPALNSAAVWGTCFVGG